ncbi:MAG: hypothetical protein GXO25_04000, partial [Euryarchaeota archaeon]|nr:hypothetical protein [Euryarchaeota archaeon]
ENNVLVRAENATRYYLNTEDNYLFNGEEINGTITLGLGEFGEDDDYFDSVKLYKVMAPSGYALADGNNGKVYEYRHAQIPWNVKDNNGINVKNKIENADGNYWIGNKGDYIDFNVNLSKKNLLLIRGIDNPPSRSAVHMDFSRPPATESTIWIYENMSGKWVKLSEIKVRHNLHTNAINLNHLTHMQYGSIELRFEMRDRNGVDYIGITHHFKYAKLKNVKMISASTGYQNLSFRDGKYVRITPGNFVTLKFRGAGNGWYLIKMYGFYFNRDKIGRGIGLIRENVTNIAEAKLVSNVTAGNYVLLPLLSDYNDIVWIAWIVDGHYTWGEKPVIHLVKGTHYFTLYVFRANGSVERYDFTVT